MKKVSSQSLTTSWAKEAFLDRRKASDLALTLIHADVDDDDAEDDEVDDNAGCG